MKNTHPTRYAGKTDAELAFLIMDAQEAAKSMGSIGNEDAEAKYLDQVNDALTEKRRRQVKK
jgi:hypothetical protein